MSVMDITARGTVLDAARVGDTRAFVGLLEPHRQTLWTVCLRITNEQRCAIDALGQGVTAAWRAMGDYPAEAQFGLWLSRTLASAARLVAWHRQRAGVAAPSPRHPATRPTDQRERLLQARLEALPVVVRETIALREVCGLTYEQIAEHQGVGVRTVKERLQHAVGLRALDEGPQLDRVHFDQLLRCVLMRQLQEAQGSVSR